ncbi:sensor histidine kinase [Streptomyces hydrogenans]|nr:HAMP domain-containing sensor histidine kinase [Streptomyces hydrogenans]
MDVNAAVAALAAIAGVCTGVIAMLAFRWSERDQARPTRTSLHTDAVLPPGVDTVLSVLRSSAVVLDESDSVVKASSAAYALGLVRGGKLAVEPMLNMARDTRRDGEIRQVELDLPRRGGGRGEALAVSARVAPLGSRLVLLLVEDLTEARRIEAVRRDFVANVSHELKTPVGALSLLSEAVMDASDDPEAVVRFAGRMQIEATRLTNLVQELIDLSRVQNDDPLEDSEPVSVDELVAEAIDRSRHPASTKQITMASGGSADLFVWGSRGQLAAALGNLVENAVNYSPARTRVGIAARRGRSSSTCRISPSLRVSRAMLSIGSTASFPPRTSPRAYAAELAFTTESLSSSTTAEERSTESTVSTPGGSTASVCREVRVGRAWSRSLQRNASMAITPVHTPAIAANAATAAFTSMPSRLCVVTDTLPAVRVAARTLVAQSSPWGRGRFICPGSHGPPRRPEFTFRPRPVHVRGWSRTHRGPNVGAWGPESGLPRRRTL